MIDRSLQSYWVALRMLRGAPNQEQREAVLKGHFTMTMCMEKRPPIKARLQAVIQEELRTA